MLIAIDHITLAADNIEKYYNILCGIGYSKYVHVQNIRNIELKKKYLQHYIDTQSFYVIKKQGSINIEIIKDSSRLHGKSCYIPLYRNGYINGVSIKVFNQEKFIQQWSSIGFKNDNNTLYFTSFGNSYIVKPIKTTKNTYFLDNKGFVCAAFISTSINDDYDNMQKNGFELSVIDCIIINNKMLKLFFAKGANNELIEIIGLHNGK